MDFWALMEGLFYAVNIIVFYGYIVLVGREIFDKCQGVWYCRRHFQITSIGTYTYSVDLADGQWRDLRNSLWLLWATMIFVTILQYLLRYARRKRNMKDNETLAPTVILRLLVGLVFIIVLHHYHALVILLIVCLGYLWTRMHIRWNCSIGLTWIFGLAVLLVKESHQLQNRPNFSLLKIVFTQSNMYRWQLPANFLVLRIISFAVDYRLAIVEDENMSRIQSTANIDEIKSVNSSRPLSQYNFVNFLAYALYAPLYMAGPIISFNAFMNSSYHPQMSENYWLYGLRWLISFGIMEYLTCNFPMFAIIASGLFPHLSATQLAVASYVILKMMWLKFLLIWRFFRLWALADGTLPPENMLRCMTNNYSLSDFWRGWHASFNQWIVRYMYLPLGGTSCQLWNVWPIFLFVALWHDIEMKLMIWGLLNGIFFVAEIWGVMIMKTDVMRKLPAGIIQVICVVSGATYVLVLVSVNLIGYSVGVGGVRLILEKLLTQEGRNVLLCSFYFLFFGVSMLMYLERMGLTKRRNVIKSSKSE